MGILIALSCASACGTGNEGSVEPGTIEEVGAAEQAVWTGWETIGGSPVGGPAIVTWGTQSMSAFWRDGSNNLKHKWFPYNNTWSWEQQLATGVVASDPAAASWSSTHMAVFWRGTDGRLQQISWNSGTWSSPSTHSDLIASAPAALSRGNGQLDVFWRASDGTIRQKSYSGGTWSTAQNLGGSATTDPAAVHWGQGRMSVFWRGSDGHVKHKWYPYNGGWSWEQDLGGNIAAGSSPGATSWGNGAISVFWRGTDDHLKHRWYPYNNDWSWEQDLGGNLQSSPDATSWGDTRIDVVATVNGQVQHKINSASMFVPLVAQTQTNWCWAASGEMITTYYGNAVAQCTMANWATSRNDCCNASPPAACNVTGWTPWATLGYTTQQKTTLTLADIQAEVAANRPWTHTIAWVGGGGHMMVGVDTFRFNNDDWVVLNNPGGGTEDVVTYAAYTSVAGSYNAWTDHYNIQ
ncbi:C39 family peptidase [Sorangium sp. So ce394]|uniref:C39 family peptidase n=1 Tax=Sorangium sp. So ce394 TaxID=3133310 RepID=UPI003F5AFFC7